MSRRLSRRTALKGALAAASVLIVSPSMARTFEANEKVRMANIGIGGQGGRGLGAASGEQLVAVCDIDLKGHAAKSLAGAKQKFPNVQVYTDIRKLFDAHAKELDAVWVATPDHTHFAASVRALEAGLAVVCEKPLTWCAEEARKLAELSKVKKVATQLANQGHGGEWINAIKSGKPETCGNFEYSGRLTEIMHLGNIALRTGEKLTYDFAEGQFTGNAVKANALLKRQPRNGWEFGYV